MLNILFFGSPTEVTPILQTLIDAPDINIIAVITQPDRIVGKKKIPTPTPVKSFAGEQNLPVLTPYEFDGAFFLDVKNHCQKSKINHPDLAILAAYGNILPHAVLNLPTHGIINLHPSLLPQYRGATPTVPPILTGQSTTGLTYMIMDEAMDHGPLLAQFESPVQPDDTHLSLTARLFQQGAQYLPDIITEYINSQQASSPPANLPAQAGEELEGVTTENKITTTANQQPKNLQLHLPPQPQNHDHATFTPILKRQHGGLPWELFTAALNGQPAPLDLFPKRLRQLITDVYQPDQAPVFVEHIIRALSPWPGAWVEIPHLTTKKGHPRRLKLLTAKLENGKLIPLSVRLEGKATTNWPQFQEAYLSSTD